MHTRTPFLGTLQDLARYVATRIMLPLATAGARTIDLQLTTKKYVLLM